MHFEPVRPRLLRTSPVAVRPRGEDTLQKLDLTEAHDCILHVVLSIPLRSDEPKDFVREMTEQCE